MSYQHISKAIAEVMAEGGKMTQVDAIYSAISYLNEIERQGVDGDLPECIHVLEKLVQRMQMSKAIAKVRREVRADFRREDERA